MGKDVIIACDFAGRSETLDFLSLFGEDKPFVKIGMNVGPNYGDREYLNRLFAAVQERNRPLPGMKKAAVVIAAPGKLPSASGIKVRRMELRRQIARKEIEFTMLDGKLENGGAGPAKKAEPTAEERELKELRGQVRRTFSEVLDIDPAEVTDTAHFVNDLGGDSLQSISLAIKLEEKYDLLIPNEAFQSCVCVDDVAHLLYRLRHGPGRDLNKTVLHINALSFAKNKRAL